MAGIAENVATHVAQSITDKAMQELKYLCCYNSYVNDFAEEKTSLSAKREIVLKNIEEAKNRNESQIEDDVDLWLTRANGLIEEDTKGKKKWFGLIPNCFWQYKRGKELEGKTMRIKRLIEESNFPRVARSTGLPGIEFYSPQNFMDFEDRKFQFEKLKEALKDDKKFMIGLYGLGGTGKTTMALQVGKEVAESKVFDKVIFTVVSKDANLKEIRDKIAKQLDLTFNEVMDEAVQAQELWKRIREGGEKVLIILDDAWEKLVLGDIGIPLGCHSKSCCTVLVTTRDWRVCRDMGYHEIIKLEVLNENDAVELFLSYAGESMDDSSNDFKDAAKDIVNECGRLPVAIVAVAKALKSRPLIEWKHGLKRLQHLKSIHDVNEDLKVAYNSLRLSYDYLKNEKAKKLFLLCSLFPEDYEIPIELLARVSIGLRLCGEASRYSIARSHFTPILNELMDSCLLLKGENGAVKMHDLVREVALWIGNKQVQVDTDSSRALIENIQYASRNIADFHKNIGGRKLEVLLLWISNHGDSTAVKVSDGIFEGMESLKILALMSREKIRISASSLFQSHLSLINVRALVIKRFELGDISILANLKILESLELSECSMTELPKEIGDLEKLRLLEVVGCVIERNNPFEVIGNCLQLEELYFVSNGIVESETQITTLPDKLEKYQIKGGSEYHHIYEMDFSISRCFDSTGLTVNFSNEVFKSLVSRAEVLELDGDYYNKGWTNIVPNILPVEDDNMKRHLIRLCLKSINGINCLIPTEHLQSGVAIFSNLAELELFKIDLRELCGSPCPINFLKKLEKLDLSFCEKLEGSLFNGKLELCNLKSIYLFHCSQLKYIVTDAMEDHHPSQKSQNDSIFPKLNRLKIRSCPVLEFVFPIGLCEDLPLLETMWIYHCKKLEYIFGQYQEERDLHQMRKEAILQSLKVLEIENVPNFINIYVECNLPLPCSNEVQKSSPSSNVENGSSDVSRSCLCCFWPKSNASSLHHPSAFMNNNQASKVKYVVNRALGLFTPPLYPFSLLSTLKISKLVGLKSLFTLSIASSLKLLEDLDVRDLNTLEHIVTDEEHTIVNNSIFPKLQRVWVLDCTNLEYIFPAFNSKGFKDLEHIWIRKAERLTHVFGKCQADHNHNGQVDLNLPALKILQLEDLPNMVSICTENYSMREVYLERICLGGCPKLLSETLTDLLAVGNKIQEGLSRRQELSHMSFQNLSRLELTGCKELKFILSTSTSRILRSLKYLWVSECEDLESIIEDDEENNKNAMAPNQVWFPELREIIVWNCKSLKSLFSVPMGKIPRLLAVGIKDAPQLREVFGWKHGEGQKLVAQKVFPKLYAVRLQNLPTLCTICHGIDFQALKLLLVRDCPSISLTPASYSAKELIELAHSLRRNPVYGEEDVAYLSFRISIWADEIRRKEREAMKEGSTEYKQSPRSPKLSEIEGEGEENVGNNSTMPQHNNGSPNFENSEEVSHEIIGEDSTINSDLPNLTGDNMVHKASSSTPSEITISNQGTSASIKNNRDSTIQKQRRSSPNLTEIEEEGSQQDIGTQQDIGKDSPNFDVGATTSLYDSHNNAETSTNEIVEERLSPSNTAATPLSKSDRDLCAKESMVDEQALRESGSSKNEAPQRVEEPIHQSSSKETSNEVLLKILPPPFTEMTFALTTQIETSTTHKEMESSSSQFDLSTISVFTDQTVQELCDKVSKGDQEARGEGTTTKIAVEIPPNTTTAAAAATEIMSPRDPSNTLEKPHIATSIVECPQVESTVINRETFSEEEEMKSDQKSPVSQIFEEHDLMRLFQMMKEGADMEVDSSYVPKLIADLQHNQEVTKALSDLEASLKMSLNEIASSEENKLRLYNALNILSSHCSKDGPSSHGLQDTIQSLQQEIQMALSSFSHAHATIDTFNKLEQKKKLMIDQCLKRERDAKTLLSDISNTKNSIVEAQLNEAELKEKISKLRDDLSRKEKEIEEYERRLIYLQEEEKKSVSDTIGFTMEFLAMEKERSLREKDEMKARQQLETMEAKWYSCLSNMKKTTMLLGVHLKQKL